MLINPVQVKTFCGLAVLALAADVAPIPPGPMDTLGRLTLDGVLVMGVIALWKALGAKDQRIAQKDEQLIAMTSKVTEVMTQVLDAVKELRFAVNALQGAEEESNRRARRATNIS